MDPNEVQRLKELSAQRHGGKATKYPLLEPVLDDITELINVNVALTVIRDWLAEKKGVTVVLNTLRKFVVLHIGRANYEAYLKRNGWAKNIHEKRVTRPRLVQSVTATSTSSNVGDARNVMSGLENPKTPGTYDPNADISHLLEIDQDAK